MTDVLAQIGTMEWRGVAYPIAARQSGFSTDLARHKFIFRDDELIEQLGARNWSFGYTIPFREDIAKGPYQNLFSKGLQQFIKDCRDRTPGDLYDPVMGPFRAYCVSLRERTDNNKRDGTDVVAEFLYAPEPDAQLSEGAQLASIDVAKSEAGALDKEAGEILRSRQQEPPEPMVNPLDAVGGALKQVSTKIGQVQAKVADFSSRVAKFEDAVSELEEPDLAPTVRSLRNLRESARRMEERAFRPDKKFKKTILSFSGTVSEVAALFGVPAEKLLGDNPLIAKTNPYVPAGTEIFHE